MVTYIRKESVGCYYGNIHTYIKNVHESLFFCMEYYVMLPWSVAPTYFIKRGLSHTYFQGRWSRHRGYVVSYGHTDHRILL